MTTQMDGAPRSRGLSNLARAGVSGVALLAVGGTALGLFVAQAPEQSATELVLEDTAQIMDADQLEAAVDEVEFHDPTQVVVFTHRGGSDAGDQSLNDAVLAHAEESRPEWLSQDRQTWADGLYILAVDPEARLVGTYFGDDRAVGEDEQLDIQDATKDDFRAGRWTEGAVAGIEAGARRINAPFMRSAGGIALGAVGVGGILAAGGTWLGIGVARSASSRRLREDADRRLADVQQDAAATERHAKRIPDESRYGFEVLRRFDDYRRGVRELSAMGEQVARLEPRTYNRKATADELTAYQEKAVELDHLDDAIADTAIFLNQDPDWREAWGRQVDPLREDLERLGPLLGEELPEQARDLPAGATLDGFATQALGRLDEVQAGLEGGQVSPDDALDTLREVRDQLSTHLEELSDEVVQAVGKDESQRETLRTSLAEQRAGARPEPSIIGTAYPAWTFFPVAAMSSGVSDGTQQIASAAGGGATAGYSAGGFSGAGSSSSF
ncbi:DUF5129 domain-containing protein [Serinicoccus kebangsaanensis]|uniref:DUF5129 domain-containing protein n=1 Tax=Serinicoccus kebangsaanensis TaxID=2602069 RepID=UPI00178C49A8|nr:DUF5129 domain-containing protein [Serinicoccus kebangsaanensis]